ncbi:MAG: IS1380 family transposase [Verrucomicrobiales bacterium]
MTLSEKSSSPPVSDSDPIAMATLFGRQWEARFDEPELTSDAGLAAPVSSGIADEVIASLAAAMDDPRKNPEHSGEQLLRQRIFQIIGGYYDANDSDQLRDDMVMRTAAGKSLEQGGLASQPTISRLEGRASTKDLLRMARVLFDDYLDSFNGEVPKMICIDMDPSAHLVYGQQQLGLFNTHVGDTCMMPFYIFDGINGKIMTATLRPGKTPTDKEIITIVKRLIKGIRARFADTIIVFRADSHHTKPAVMDYLEEQRVEFVTGLAKNKALERLFAADIAKAEERYECRKGYDSNPNDVIEFADDYYAAGTWSSQRRIIARIIVGPKGVDVRYIVSSFQVATAQYLYTTVYCGRGEAELFIKECKLGLGSDTSPCQKATANQFRLLLHAAAYAILHRFRSTVLAGTKWERCTFAEIRLRLFKVAGRIEVLKTKVRLHLSAALKTTQRLIWQRCGSPAPQ